MKIFITGANRGLGLEFTRQYLSKNHIVMATCRDLDRATNLKRLKTDYPDQLSIIMLDVTSKKSRDQLISKELSNFKSLDLLINNAGIVSGGDQRSYILGELHTEEIEKVFKVNAIAPLLMIESLLPLLKQGKNPKIVNISSTMGSITNKAGTQNYSYSSSKAALNMFSKMLANDLYEIGISVLILHPGWVQTDMGGSVAPIKIQDSIRGMIQVIKNHKLAQTGEFRDYMGDIIPW